MATVTLTISDVKVEGIDAVEITAKSHENRFDLTLTKGEKFAAVLMKIAGLLLEQ